MPILLWLVGIPISLIILVLVVQVHRGLAGSQALQPKYKKQRHRGPMQPRPGTN